MTTPVADRRGRTVALVATALLLLAACGQGQAEETGAPSAPSTSTTTAREPTGSPTPDPEPVVAPPFPRTTALQHDRGSGPWELVLDQVRVGEHPGFDRIVVELTGAGVPGWAVQYVDRPRLDGSGEHVSVAGDAFLDIYASHTTWSPSDLYDGPTRLPARDSTGVDEVYVVGTFEGDTQVIAGVRGGARPFRVFTLSDPARLVVDVAAPRG